MEKLRSAVIGIGATGTVLAAALLKNNPETALVGHRPELKDEVLQNGIIVSGALNYHEPVINFSNLVKAIESTLCFDLQGFALPADFGLKGSGFAGQGGRENALRTNMSVRAKIPQFFELGNKANTKASSEWKPIPCR